MHLRWLTLPMLFNTNDVIPTCLNVLQPPHISLPLISEVLAECHSHTDMSEIPPTGTLPSDAIVAAVHSTNPNELHSLLMFKDERRILQERAPVITPVHGTPSRSARVAWPAILFPNHCLFNSMHSPIVICLLRHFTCVVVSMALVIGVTP